MSEGQCVKCGDLCFFDKDDDDLCPECRWDKLQADLRELVVEWGNEYEYARKYKDPIPYHEAILLCRKQLLEKLG